MTSAAIEPHEILVCIQAHDRQALATLYDHYAPRLYAVAVRILANPVLAEELLIDVFRRLWHGTLVFDAHYDDVGTWLLLIVRRRALSRRATVLPSSHHRLSDDGLEASESPAVSERRQIITAALDFLPATQRELLDLAFYEGLNQQELALTTGRPPAQVRLALSEALNHLQVLLTHLWGSVAP